MQMILRVAFCGINARSAGSTITSLGLIILAAPQTIPGEPWEDKPCPRAILISQILVPSLL